MRKVLLKKILLLILLGILVFNGFGAGTLSMRVPSLQLSSSLIEYDMVIFAPERYASSIQPLIDHKNSIGIQTFFSITEEIYDKCEGRDHAEQLKYYIKKMVEENAINYVLFIGGISDIPGRYTHIYFDEPFDYPTPNNWVFTSDFYYADIYDQTGLFSNWDSNNNNVFAEYHWNGNTDEIDLEPDVYIGRLACINETQVQTCVNKIIQYETNKSWMQDWFTNLTLIAGDGIPFDPENIDESEYLQEHIIEIMDGFIPNCIWASNGKLSNAYNINDAVEQGTGFIFFNGHGLHDRWVTYMHNSQRQVPPGCYKTNHINQLTNRDKLPIIISDACYHLQYDAYPNCFGWSFVSNPNGGAIAFIGGSDTDLAYAGSRIVEKGIEKLDLKICNLYQEGEMYLGDLWGKGIIAYQPIQGDLVDLLTILQNHLFGDPSLQISSLSQPPSKPEIPKGPLEGEIGIHYFFTTSSTDPDEDNVYFLFDWEDNSTNTWIGPFESGEECNVSHTWKNKGAYKIRVKAKDSFGVQSDWSDPLSVNMPKSKSINTLNSLFFKLFELFPLIEKLIQTEDYLQ